MSRNAFPAVIYLDRNRLDFYGSNVSSVLTLVFPTQVVDNLEILNPVEIKNLIISFIKLNKISPTNLIIVFSKNIIFEKEFEKTIPNIEEATQKFIDAIPFENIISKVYHLEKIDKVIAINKDFYEYVKNNFESAGFTTDIIVPDWALGSNINIQNGLDIDSAKVILERLELIKLYNLSIHQDNSIPLKSGINNNSVKNQNNTRTFILLSVFAVLLVILIFMVVGSFSAKSSIPKNIIISPTPHPTVFLPTVIPTAPLNVIPTIQSATSSAF